MNAIFVNFLRLTESIFCVQGYDGQVGVALLTFGIIASLYYTSWVLLVPFVNEKHYIRSIFIEETVVWALGIPIAVGTLFFLSVAIFACVKMRNNKLKVN